MIKQTHQLDELLTIFKKYDNEAEHLAFIKKAYNYANEIHANETRLNNELVIDHLTRVAIILTDLTMDYVAIAFALLHEVMTDNKVTLLEIEETFNKELADLIDGISKINRLNFGTSNEAMIQSERKIFVGLAKDPRVIIIKIADRLDNLRHLDHLPINAQKQKAKETLEIFIPIAHRLGLNNIKSELEELSLKYSKREAYDDVINRLAKSKGEREKALSKMKKELINILEEAHLKYELKGRSKSIYSIYKKLDKGRMFSDIYDLLALRVLVEKETDCYLLLGLIHSKYKYIPSRFKDFIAMPKNNMYQSLHTTIFGNDGNIFEIQIRTFDMNSIAERGIASHWSYKEKGKNNKVLNTMDQKLKVFRDMIESSEEATDSDELVESVKDEILHEDIYVYTPNGDVIELPIGSTPVDFAYKVHSKVGESMIGAIVNNNIVPLSYELESGDIIKINTTKKPTGPKLEWLNFARTSQAKNRIKAYFSKNEKDNYINKGLTALQKELRKRKIEFSMLTDSNNLNPLLEELKLKTIDDLYYSVGSNRLTAGFVINTLTANDEPKESLILKKVLNAESKEITIKNDIIVEGIDDIKVTLSRCCMPVYGDNIVGYITKGNGISVHREGCPNIVNNDRTITVKWNCNLEKKYNTTIQVAANKTENGLITIINKAALSNVTIETVNTIDKQDFVLYEMTVLTTNKDDLDKYITNIHSLAFVQKVERIIK